MDTTANVVPVSGLQLKELRRRALRLGIRITAEAVAGKMGISRSRVAAIEASAWVWPGTGTRYVAAIEEIITERGPEPEAEAPAEPLALVVAALAAKVESLERGEARG